MRKLILNLAMSIDGYIADNDGGYAWITGDGKKLQTQQAFQFERFLEQVDTVVMGRHCYDQGQHRDFPQKRVYVATSEERPADGNCIFLGRTLFETIAEEKEKEGKDIFLYGGGILADHFLQRDMIDEYILGIIPTLLGQGRPLFLGGTPHILLNLEQFYVEDGICILHYTKR